MPEYVYALHDFLPEHEDEVSFHAGERIEIVEKDDLYQDGWWQGKNLAGRVGLFPQSYTTPAPPDLSFASSSSSTTVGDSSPEPSSQTDKSTLQPLEEVSEPGTPPPPKDTSTTTIVAPVPTSPAVFMNGNTADEELTHRRTVSGGEEVMRATMTDVQKAIEQLGQGRGMHEDADDGTRSFSFASTKDGAETETDTEFDMSDVDGGDAQPETYHKDTRMKLAAKARRAIEEAEKLEAMITTNRLTAPPIEVDISDESEGEDDHQDFTSRASAFPRSHPHIPEEDEDGDTNTNSTKVHNANRLSDEVASRASSTPHHSTQFAERLSSEVDDQEPRTAAPARATFGFPLTPSKIATFENVGRQSPPVVSVSKPSSPVPRIDTSSLSFLPLPRSESPKHEASKLVPHSPVPLPNGTHNSYEIKAPAPARSPSPLALTPQSQLPSAVTSSTLHAPPSEKGSGDNKTHPSEWTVDQVVDWLKGKGFDQDVCDKFIEQEISGDVLLELDANLLKTEIGIMAFGKRVRIANAISDLKRPPSITYSDRAEQSPSSPHTHNLPQSHNRSQSQSQSHHSFPGANGNGYLHSPHSPLGSPLGPISHSSPNHSAGLGGQYVIVGADSPVRLPPIVGLGLASGSNEGSATSTTGTLNDSNKAPKARPSQLSLSPSDGALSNTAKAIVDIPEERHREKGDDRGHMSESEAVPATSIRRRLFGRSHDSTLTKVSDRDSKAESTKSDGAKPTSPQAASPPATAPIEKEKEKEKEATGRTARAKKSIDGGRGDRLSIFGGTFGPSLGKSRKPPPRYSSDDSNEKSSMFGLPRLHASGSSRRTSNSSGRPSTPTQTSPQEPKDKSKDNVRNLKEDQVALLRKRTSSAVSGGDATKANGGIISPLKPGMSVLEQIGEPDHNGWMRKKGDRYNSWKLRYFVLKGPHMYCLRSNGRAETRIKGYVNVTGYKVTVDETIDPGRYGFRIDHDQDKTHYFSSDEKAIVREWMKAIMKATIGRDYTRPVISSCNIPTIPLMVAQAMNPAPRPPSPTARDATQKALRRENPNQLSSRDARILMGLPGTADVKDDRTRLDSFFTEPPKVIESPGGPAPPRPSREMRRMSSTRASTIATVHDSLIEWANSHLPEAHQITDSSGPLCSGLALLRLAESIKGKPSSPPVPDSAFPTDPNDEKLDGLFRLFDFLLDNEVKMGSVSINDVRQGKRDKIIQLLKALKAWEDKRRAIVHTIGAGSAYAAGGFIAPMTWA